MKNCYILVLISFVSCKPGEDKQQHTMHQDTVTNLQDELHDSDHGIFYFDYPVTDKLTYTLKFILPEHKVLLLEKPAGTMLQELKIGEDVNLQEGHYAENPEQLFSVSDLNFDGFRDIAVLRVSGVSNLFFDYYLYSPESGQWVFDNELSEYANLSVDEKNRQLSWHNKGGYGGAWYEAGVLEWHNGKLTVMRLEEQTSDGDDNEAFIRTIQVYRDGGLKIASRVHISEADGKEKQCLLEGEWAEFDRTPMLIFAEAPDQVVRVDGRKNGCRY